MNNLFEFEYTELALNNADGTPSNFRQVFGNNGVNMACPKGSYHIVKTADVSTLGQAFIDKGYAVETFEHRNGEKIGLKVSFGNKPSKVGESSYELIITVPNNGGGKGYLSIKQLRLICGNGMMSNKTVHKDNYIKIPHTINYKESLKMMENSINGFVSLLEQVESNDIMLDGNKLTHSEAMYNLNKWFFENEAPTSQKKDMTLDSFRKQLAVAPTTIKFIGRYDELKVAFNKELEYNKELGLDLSMYTVYASVTNYLSRRIEKSGSTASETVQFERTSKKLEFFEGIVE
jgi:effector-binding domain-containing protein